MNTRITEIANDIGTHPAEAHLRADQNTIMNALDLALPQTPSRSPKTFRTVGSQMLRNGNSPRPHSASPSPASRTETDDGAQTIRRCFWQTPASLRTGLVSFVVVVLALCAFRTQGQITYSNLTVTISANDLRDRLYDCSTASALMSAPIHAAVLHLMDEAMGKNPGVLSTADAVTVMQNVINGMTNDFGSTPQVTMQDLTSLALPYLQSELGKKLPTNTVNAIQTGLGMVVVAEQQGLFSSVYSNLTTALPSGSIFSDLDNTASSVLALQRQAASQMATLALPEQIRTASETAFRDAAAQLVSQITSITPEDALDTIVRAVPALRNNQLVTNLAQAAQQAGQVVVDVNQLVTNATSALDALHLSITTDADLLGQIASEQQDIIGSLADPQVLSDSRNNALQVSSDISTSIDAAQPIVTFTSTLINIAGNPQLAQQLATVGSAAIKVANAVSEMSDAISSAQGVFSSVGGIATGNFIGAALDVFSMFGGGASGPNPDQVILDQIGAVRQDIASMRADMDNRFDQVDAALTNIMETLDSNFGEIFTQFDEVLANLAAIGNSVAELQGQVQKLENQIWTYFEAWEQENLNGILNGALGYENRVGTPMPSTGTDSFEQYENQLFTSAYMRSCPY